VATVPPQYDNLSSCRPVSASQMRADLSSDAVTMRQPSVLKAPWRGFCERLRRSFRPLPIDYHLSRPISRLPRGVRLAGGQGSMRS
jgi:hypothetical protein